MESLGTIFLFTLIIISLVSIFLKKLRIIGFVLFIISIVFLFVFPKSSFSKYKKDSQGIYTNSKLQKIVIKDGNFIFYEGSIKTFSGVIEYSNIDDYSFFFNGQYISTEKGKIVNLKNGLDVFYKKE
jgi:hypothetical protein